MQPLRASMTSDPGGPSDAGLDRPGVTRHVRERKSLPRAPPPAQGELDPVEQPAGVAVPDARFGVAISECLDFGATNFRFAFLTGYRVELERSPRITLHSFASNGPVWTRPASTSLSPR